jgi:hypothetical protein
MLRSKWFRSQAARLLKLAEEAKEKGNFAIASRLTDAAAQYQERAITLELHEKATATDGPGTLQQQQQVQPGGQDFCIEACAHKEVQRVG